MFIVLKANYLQHFHHARFSVTGQKEEQRREGWGFKGLKADDNSSKLMDEKT